MTFSLSHLSFHFLIKHEHNQNETVNKHLCLIFTAGSSTSVFHFQCGGATQGPAGLDMSEASPCRHTLLQSQVGVSVYFPMTSLFSVVVVASSSAYCFEELPTCGQQAASQKEIWLHSKTMYSMWMIDGRIHLVFA